MIIDANLLLYSVDTLSPHHERAVDWLESTLRGTVRVALPWTVLLAFARVATHPGIFSRPMTAAEASERVGAWLDAPGSWVPPATERTGRILIGLLASERVTGNLVPDAALAALAIEHGLEIMTADTDFARFPEVRWRNPLRGA